MHLQTEGQLDINSGFSTKEELKESEPVRKESQDCLKLTYIVR